MSLKTIVLIIAVAIFGGAVTAFATQEHSTHNGHGKSVQSSNGPTEPGQAAFAAIAEIVRILEADPDTDWAKVNIQTLRDHLVDMNALTLRANVKQVIDDTGITFIVTGEGDALRAIKTMVPAHAKELEKMEGWTASTELQPDGAKLLMLPTSDKEKSKILALGFFGLMATGSHHQPHHLGMATGQMAHH